MKFISSTHSLMKHFTTTIFVSFFNGLRKRK